MRIKITRKVESFILRTRSRLYCWYYWRDSLKVLKLRKRHAGIQLKPAELLRIFHAIRKFEHCRLLVFGLGYDSPFWCEVNKSGRSVFIEDDEPWLNKITGEHPLIEAYSVSYPCNITEWQEVLTKPERLAVRLPQGIALCKWDVIIVDGPRGHRFAIDLPGRMSSIYMASRLVGQGGYVFVHDAERKVETAYSAKYLGEDYLVDRVRGRALLKVFHFPFTNK